MSKIKMTGFAVVSFPVNFCFEKKENMNENFQKSERVGVKQTLVKLSTL